ncbi:MAG: hypothetical protein IJY17_06950 [Alphaproteobacteria bacterium]|nr:hypothetical protein [Alphaproteobacteria bacterium]
MNANQGQKTVESIKKVSSEYTPYLALALCWKDKGQTGLFYDKVPASFARHPCDLFDKENGNREEWKNLTGYKVDNCKDMLPKKAKCLRNNIAGGLQVSNFGRVGIPIKCNGENELFKGCKGCALSERTVSIALEENKTESIDKCTKFHFILPQYEKCSWNENDYNGYLMVDIKTKEENWKGETIKIEKRLVYPLVAEAFKMKESTLKYLEEENPNLITYINEIIDETVNNKALKKEAIEELNKAIETLRKGETISLQIHHIDNNGHHNTPTYWDENGTMIKGNLIALPDSVHKKL